ncbi:hypothetical protein [Streptomyces sp. NPDC127033]|uniref:hypothetical protein n=1 Tax=Streptomyces sp. NPDC127033 TaxID=3347110 RepID=UPI00365D2111
MRQIDLLAQIDSLRQLGRDFATLHTTVQKLEVRPGSDTLLRLGPQILAINELVGRTLAQLTDLHGSQYTAVPGSRYTLKSLSSIVSTATLAASGLATTLYANPPDAAGFGYEPPEEEAARQAVPALAGFLTDAARQLDRCAATCRSAAADIIRNLKNHPEQQPALPDLTPAQYGVLRKVAEGGARRYVRAHGKGIAVRAADGTPLRPAAFGTLAKHRLVSVDALVSPVVGQEITVTAAGELALYMQPTARARPAVPPAAPSQEPPSRPHR